MEHLQRHLLQIKNYEITLIFWDERGVVPFEPYFFMFFPECLEKAAVNRISTQGSFLSAHNLKSVFLGSQSKGIRLEEGESPIHIPSGSLTQGAMALIVSPKPGTMPHEFTPVFRGPSSVILDIEMPFGSRMPVSSMPRSRKRFFDEGWRHVLHLSPHVTHEGAWLRDLYVSAQYIILLLDIWPFVAK
ncbi:hypothetical protein RHSIM_Rhsim05G0132500 [Rhododendron simsii]|uniref:Uncharacterized protein n=1 Tax=Rhododendron simsii TaxID=118357 RepID=A0A834LNI3_RHOSS|nr:hypothetical protein RHSIM_Rhsim05G0132500 [Rhododendron simsii]